VLTTNTQFELHLKKRIDEEIVRINDVLMTGVPDFANYRYHVGMVFALRRCAKEFCDDANTELNKR
jgi:hypothetical protein